jgi:hypothetical protein
MWKDFVTVIGTNIFYERVYLQIVYGSVQQLFSPAAHPNLSKTHDGTLQHFPSRKVGTKFYMAINKCLHTNPCPTRMQAHENTT